MKKTAIVTGLLFSAVLVTMEHAHGVYGQKQKETVYWAAGPNDPSSYSRENGDEFNAKVIVQEGLPGATIKIDCGNDRVITASPEPGITFNCGEDDKGRTKKVIIESDMGGSRGTMEVSYRER